MKNMLLPRILSMASFSEKEYMMLRLQIVRVGVSLLQLCVYYFNTVWIHTVNAISSMENAQYLPMTQAR